MRLIHPVSIISSCYILKAETVTHTPKIMLLVEAYFEAS